MLDQRGNEQNHMMVRNELKTRYRFSESGTLWETTSENILNTTKKKLLDLLIFSFIYCVRCEI